MNRIAECRVLWPVARSDVSWSVQPRVGDEGAGGLPARPRYHRHQGLRGPGGPLRIHAYQTGWMVSNLRSDTFNLTVFSRFS